MKHIHEMVFCNHVVPSVLQAKIYFGAENIWTMPDIQENTAKAYIVGKT